MNNKIKELKLTKEQKAQFEKNKKEIKKLIEMRQKKLPKDLKKVKDLAQFHIDPSTFVQNVLHGRVAIFNKDQAIPLMINGVELSGVTSGLRGRDGYVNNNYNYIELADLPLEVFDSIDIMDDSTNDRILNLTINGHDNTKGTQLRLKGHIKDDTNDNYINEDNEDNLDGSMLINFGGNIGDNASLKLVLFSQKNKFQTNSRTKFSPNYNGENYTKLYQELYDYINNKEGYSLTFDVSINDNTSIHVSKFHTKNKDNHDGKLGWLNREGAFLYTTGQNVTPYQIDTTNGEMWSSESKEIDVTNMKLVTSFGDVSVEGELKNSKVHKKTIDSTGDQYFMNNNLSDGRNIDSPYSKETQDFANHVKSIDEYGFTNFSFNHTLLRPILGNISFFGGPNTIDDNINETGNIDEYKLNLFKPININLGNLRVNNIDLNLASKRIDFEKDEIVRKTLNADDLLNTFDLTNPLSSYPDYWTQISNYYIAEYPNNAPHFKEEHLEQFNTNRFDGDKYPTNFRFSKYNLLRNMNLDLEYEININLDGSGQYSKTYTNKIYPKWHNKNSINLVEVNIDGNFSDSITYKLGNKFVSIDYEKNGNTVLDSSFGYVRDTISEVSTNFSKDVLLPSLNLNWKYTDDINLDFNYYRSYNDLDNETAEYRVIRRNDIVSNNVGTFTDSNDNTYTGFITVTDSYEDIDKVNFDLEVYDNIDVTSKFDLEIQGLKVKTEVNAFWKSSDSVDWDKGVYDLISETVTGGADTDGDGQVEWIVKRLYNANTKYQRNKTITGVNALVELPELEVGKISGSVKQIVSYVHTNIDVDNSDSDTDNDDLTTTHKLKAATLLSMTPNGGKTNIDTTFIYVRPEKLVERDGGSTTTDFDYQPRYIVNLSGDHKLNDQVKVHAKVTGLLNRLDQKNCDQSFKDEGFTIEGLGSDGQPRKYKYEVKHTTTYKAGLTFTV